jgi:hypothetical protein
MAGVCPKRGETMTVIPREMYYDRWPTAAQDRMIAIYGEWLRGFAWKWFITLTFSYDKSSAQADAVLADFIDTLERRIGAPVSYVCGKELKRVSGSGMPAGRVHFHLVMGCAGSLSDATISDLWTMPAFGGDRTKGSSAEVWSYDPAQRGAQYCIKYDTDPVWDWNEHNLELMSHDRPQSYATNSKMRKKWRRNQERLARCNGR